MNEVERVFREESGRILAGLLRAVGDFDLAEEALQDAFTEALEQWAREGVPRNAGAWVHTVARRRCLDRMRRKRRDDGHYRQLAPLVGSDVGRAEEVLERAELLSVSAGDDLLRLLFTCCHPSLSLEAQVALTLSTVAGLRREETARALLIPKTTLDQRLVRAKRKIHEARIPYRVPPAEVLPERLQGVLRVVYLVFNEGYTATAGTELHRSGLCEEAIRLARSTLSLLPQQPEVKGLLALLLLQHSRHRARTTDEEELVLLEDQDRSRWDRHCIEEGCRLLEEALLLRRAGPYQLQAAIAAVHARSPSFAETDWAEIAGLYAVLRRFDPSPVPALNEAVARAFAGGWDEGLARIGLLERDPRMQRYHYLHSAKADLLRRAGRFSEAADSYARALELCANASERRFLERRRKEALARAPRSN